MTTETPLKTTPAGTRDADTRLGLRAFARRHGVSHSYVLALIRDGWIRRGDDGLIDPSTEDATMREKLAMTSPIAKLAHDERRRVAAARRTSPAVPTSASGAEPSDQADDALIDVAATDAALAAQGIGADWKPRQVATEADALLERWENRLAKAQAIYLGTIFGAMRKVLDEQFNLMRDELDAFVAGTTMKGNGHGRQ